MSQQAIIVISIVEDSWALRSIRDKLLGAIDAPYVFSDDAFSEIADFVIGDEADSTNCSSKTDNDCPLLFLAAMHQSDGNDLSGVIIGRCAIEQGEDGRYLMSVCDSVLLDSARSPRPVENIRRMLNLDLSDNYVSSGYVRIEFSEKARDLIEFYLMDRSADESMLFVRQASSSEPADEDVAGRLPASPSDSAHRLFVENNPGVNNYRLDYERIVCSKAFRRMVDKAQVFTSSKGDHYRTRMTHTLEVARISRSLAERLHANACLAEAIALAHDIGHTPFGHQGERSLDDILRGRALKELELVPCGDGAPCNPYGGFKHNFQSVRVLAALEEKHSQFRGMNISAQVLEGALWHTGAPLKEGCDSCAGNKNRCCEKESFWYVPHGVDKNSRRDFWDFVFHEGDYAGFSYSRTLEGQIVAIADEIAQRGHDVEDALTAELITVDDFLDLCKMRSVDDLHHLLKKIDEEIEAWRAGGKVFVNEQRLRKDALSERIVEYLTDSVVKGSTSVTQDTCNVSSYGPLLSGCAVSFDRSGKMVCEYLDSIVRSRVLASQEVSRFDNKGQMIVEGLFKAYYLQPRLLPATSLRRMAIVERSNGCPAALDLSSCDFELGGDEIKAIQNADIAALPSSRREAGHQFSLDAEEAFKKKILVRCIVDHISGMTDSYAASEYDRIYGTQL